MQRGKIFFNIVIIIAVIALIAVSGYVGYYYISNYIAVKEAEEIVDEFENEVIVVTIDNENNQTVIEQPENSNANSNKIVKKYYKGYSMIGTIQIPKTKVRAPIVDKVTPNSISAAVATLYGPGLNKIGNTVLVAHNYRNRNFFF